MLGKSLSLRWRMTLVTILFPLLFLAPIFVLMAREYQQAYRRAYINQADLVAYQVQQTIGAISPYIYSVYDAPGINIYLQKIAQVSRDTLEVRTNAEEDTLFSFIALVFENGEIVYHSNAGIQKDEGLAHLDQIKSGDSRANQTYGTVYLVFREIPMPGQYAGTTRKLYVVVALPESVVDPPFLTWLPIILGGLLVLLLVGVIRFAMDRQVLRPLQRLAEGAAVIGAGDLNYVIPVDRDDEMGFLAQSFNEMAAQLRTMVTGLERQVAERTAALQRQANFLQASNLVSREAVQIRDVQRLLETTMRAIPGYFGFYHAGIFLLDESSQWAVLRAASSEGGQRMLARGHRLQVGAQGIVGFVASTGKPRIAFDVGDDSAWFNNPDLPRTRSEMALPLKTAEKVIGVLDVQSEEPEAFTDEDVTILQGMADQLTVALENARLLEETQATVKELESLHQDYSRSGWARVKARLQTRAYEYDRVEVHPVPPLPVSPKLIDRSASYELTRDGATPVLMAPLPVRDQVIGVLALAESQRAWTQEEIELVESVSEQVGLAIENARLFEDAQRTARHQALLNLVLQTAATSSSADQALNEMSGILSQGLDMAVGFFTFPDPRVARVQAHAFVTPEGVPFRLESEAQELSQELYLFFRGLNQPEHGRFLCPVEQLRIETAQPGEALALPYELEKVLYVPLATAGVLTGLMVLMQRAGDWLLDPETRELVQNLGRQIGIVLENMSLAEDTRRRSAELQALYEISLRLNQSMEPAELLQVVVEQALSLFDADGGTVFLVEAGSNELTLTSSMGYLTPYEGMRVNAEEGLAGRAFQTRQPQRVTDYQSWEGKNALFKESLLHALMAVPLIGLAGPLGVLGIARGPEKTAFDERDTRLAELFATQAGSALENSRLYQETTQRAEELRRLYDAGLDLISLLDVQEVVDRGADWARRLFQAPVGMIYLWDERQGRYAIGQGMDSPIWMERDVFPAPEQNALATAIRQSGLPLLIPDTRRDARVPEVLARQGLLSQMGVPLRLGNKVMGILFVTGDRPEQFTNHELQLLDFLGTQIAGAVQNAVQFAQTQSALAIVEKQALYQTSVAQATALLSERGTQALHQVMELLGEAVQADQGYYFRVQTRADGFHWHLENVWQREGAADVPTSTEFDLHDLGVDRFGYWRAQLVEHGLWAGQVRELPEAELALMDALLARSLILLAVPGDEPVPGLMVFVDRLRERVWREEENNALLTAANALASTLARERLFDQVQDALAETEALYRGGAELNMVRSYDEVLSVLRRHTALGRKAYSITIQVFDRPWIDNNVPEWAEVLARWTSVPNAPFQPRYYVASTPVASRLIMSVDEPSLIADVATDPRMDDSSRELFTSLGARSTVFIPLLVGGQRIGFINALYLEPFNFSEVEVRRIVSLGKQAAMVIQNLHQLQTIQARAQRERTIREITGKIQAAPDVQSVLKTTLQELGRALGTPNNRIQMMRPEGSRLNAPESEVSGPARAALPGERDNGEPEGGNGSFQQDRGNGGDPEGQAR